MMTYCKGCLINETCIYRTYSTLCPCGTCLVKMVCFNACDDRRYFQGKTKQYKFQFWSGIIETKRGIYNDRFL